MSTPRNGPVGKLDAQGRLDQDSFLDEAFLGDYVGGINLIYKGFARPGSSAAAAVWQIAKLSYDANNNITAIQWPKLTGGQVSSEYEFIWNNRAALTYV